MTQDLEHISNILKRDTPLPSLKPASSPGREMTNQLPAPNCECRFCQGHHMVHPLLENGKPDYSQVVPCRCVKEAWEREKRQRLLAACELPAGTEHMTFETFRLNPGLKEAYEAALALAEEKNTLWLTLMSEIDRGKTHLAVAICRHWLARGKIARYAYVPLLLEELRRGFRREDDYSYESRFDYFLNVSLLVLDDLGVENRTDWVQEKLDTLVDYRLMNGLGLVVTTNCSMEELPFRIASRLQRRGKVVVIDAPEFSEIRKKR